MKNKKRIIMVIQFLAEAGGIEQCLLDLVEEMISRDWLVCVYCCERPSLNNQYRVQFEKMGVNVVCPAKWKALLRGKSEYDWQNNIRNFIARDKILIPLISYLLSRLKKISLLQSQQSVIGWIRLILSQIISYQWLSYSDFWRAVRRRKIEIVHIHGYGGGNKPEYIWDAVQQLKIPVVYTEHGVPWPELKADKHLLDSIRQVPRFIIAVSEATKYSLEENCLVESSHILVIGHIVRSNTDLVSDLKKEPVEQKSVLLIDVAMLRSGKGHSVLLDAIKKVIELGYNIELHLIGDGECRQSLESQALQLGIHQRVVFHGALDHNQIWSWLQVSDIFVHPSFSESLGLAIVEAMACRLPVIAARTGGVPSLVEHNVSGLLVEPGNMDDLARAIQILIDNPGLRERMGMAAYQAYLQGPFTPKVVGDAIEQIYLKSLEDVC